MHRIDLPRPISTNNLFANVPGKGRVKTQDYQTWLWHVAAALTKQRPLPKFTEPVRIVYAVGEVGVSSRFDLGNAEKALTDVLVSEGVIPDDSRKWVRGIGSEWVAGKEGVTAYIGPAGGKGVAIEIPVVGVVS